MLVYQALKSEFIADVVQDAIVERITAEFEQRLHRANPREVVAWRNSMEYMYKVLNAPEIPDGCGVAIEFKVPYTEKRVDFLLTGRDDHERESAIIIELKQWQQVETVDGRDGIVRTFVAGANREVTHPSYQAWSYARMIEDYNEAVRDAQIDLEPCAYLHNYRVATIDDPLLNPRFAAYLEKAPVFCQGDVLKLRDFICRHITRADNGEILYEIESGRLRPSKSLQDALSSMLEGNDEFVMIDNQKVIFETAISLAKRSREPGEKHVMIVRGDPGTGKSVVAINLLVSLIADGMVCQYVSKNSAPRNVYSALLREGDRTMTYINGLFRGPGGFYDLQKNALDAVVVDEAHRLNEKSGFYGNEGENQMAELIEAARFSVFFIDESQRVTIKDAGTVTDIRAFAERSGARIWEAELLSQFRCNGSDLYLDWLDNVLGIASAQQPPTYVDYDFRVFDDPHALMEAVRERNGERNRSRVVAGYCWEWPTATKGNPNHHDIMLPEHEFARSWNLNSTPTWAIDDGSIDQIGCIHTSQGLEFDYVGVIVGDDMRFENGRVITDYTRRAKSDQSLKGIKTIARNDPERAQRIADEIIRNTYRVLMTRGLKGCYVFCTDRALAEHLRENLPRVEYSPSVTPASIAAETPLED